MENSRVYTDIIHKISCAKAWRIFVVVLVVVVSGATNVAQAETAEGGFIGSWLELPMGARAAAMGGAYTSINDGGYAHLYNPAGLAGFTDITFSSSHREMGIDRRLSYASMTFPAKEEASLTLSWLYADFGNVETRDNSGGTSGETIGKDEHQFSVIFAKRFSKRVAFGFKASYYYWQLDAIRSNSVLGGIGFILFIDHFIHDRETIGQGPITDIQAGIAIKSVGSSFKINSNNLSSPGRETERSFPVRGSIGLSGRVMDGKLLVSNDLEYHEILGPRYFVGAEYELHEQFKLRAGLNRAKLTAGAGFEFFTGSTSLIVDYAFQDDRVEEGAEHVFTFEVSF